MNHRPFTHGFVRTVSRSLARCELSHMVRQEFDVGRAREQHAVYVQTLRTAGVNVTVLSEDSELPDSCFVEDPVILLDELAVLCRPGCASRRPEVDLIKPFVAAVRRVHRIVEPGTLEGGDVLRLEKRFFVGLSKRTNPEGIRQLENIVGPYGYSVAAVNLHGCLHLKSAISSPVPGLLLVNPAWVDLSPFRDYESIPLPLEEPWGANVLAVNGTTLVAQSAPRTAALLRDRGLGVISLDVSELQKAEAGLTCMSVLFRSPAIGTATLD